jgi:phosphotransacetylase
VVQVQKVIDAVTAAKDSRPDLKLEGPIQYDAAIDPAVAAVKIKTKSEVAGKATVFVFPDLNTGRMFKACTACFVRSAGVI